MKKFDLSRFKKTMAGLIEFATLLEQASAARRKKIIEELEEVDRPFIRKALRKVVYFEELEHMDEGILSEILSKVSPTLLAYALRGMPDSFSKHLLRHLSYRGMLEVKEETERIPASITETSVEGARAQVLKIARELESQNRFVFELSDCPRFKEPPKRKAAGTKKS